MTWLLLCCVVVPVGSESAEVCFAGLGLLVAGAGCGFLHSPSRAAGGIQLQGRRAVADAPAEAAAAVVAAAAVLAASVFAAAFVSEVSVFAAAAAVVAGMVAAAAMVAAVVAAVVAPVAAAVVAAVVAVIAPVVAAASELVAAPEVEMAVFASATPEFAVVLFEARALAVRGGTPRRARQNGGPIPQDQAPPRPRRICLPVPARSRFFSGLQIQTRSRRTRASCFYHQIYYRPI